MYTARIKVTAFFIGFHYNRSVVCCAWVTLHATQTTRFAHEVSESTRYCDTSYLSRVFTSSKAKEIVCSRRIGPIDFLCTYAHVCVSGGAAAIRVLQLILITQFRLRNCKNLSGEEDAQLVFLPRSISKSHNQTSVQPLRKGVDYTL